MVNIQNRVAELELKNKPKTVKFGGTNLESLGDARAWLEQNMAPEWGNVSLVVDVHTCMEHVFSSLQGEEFLSKFIKVHKLDIQTIAQGLAMSSYETSIPKIYNSGKFRVIKDNASHLDNVKTWEDFA